MIYCVEDDAGIREIEVYTLRSTGFTAEGFADGKSFFEAMGEERPQLIILDVMLPGEDGISILRRIRAMKDWKSIPVIMATAKGAEYDKVTGLDTGADDYLVKPFGMMEMVSRVRAVLRRVPGAADEKKSILTHRGICLKDSEHKVLCFGQNVELTLKEYALLRLFLSNPGRVYTRDELLSILWGINYAGETRTVDVHIRTLRQKLGQCGDMIGTVRGVGYCLEADKK